MRREKLPYDLQVYINVERENAAVHLKDILKSYFTPLEKCKFCRKHPSANFRQVYNHKQNILQLYCT